LRRISGGILAALEQADGGATFRRDTWQRPEGGGEDEICGEEEKDPAATAAD
jgi:coproporphyrinogen III oxidase